MGLSVARGSILAMSYRDSSVPIPQVETRRWIQSIEWRSPFRERSLRLWRDP
jgi:hypothetical protein